MKKKANKVLSNIKEDLDNQKKGVYNYIPFTNQYPKLSSFLPGIMKGVMYMITADSGVSKTQFTKDMFVITPYVFLKKNPHIKIKYKVLYFALEESEDEFIQSFTRRVLGERHKLYLGANELRGTSNYKITEEEFKLAESTNDEVDKMLENVEVIDDVYNPTGIYNRCREYAEKWGTFEDKVVTIRGKSKIVKGKWTPHDPNLHVIVVVDHLNDFMGEKEGEIRDKATGRIIKQGKMISKSESMSKWVDRYAKKQLLKKWNFTVCNVVQQSAESGKKQFTLKGSTVAFKHVPSVANLGNNKEIQRAHYVILGLFSPDKYDIEEYNNYKIYKLGNYYRNLIILKNRIGASNGDFDFYHNGAIMKFIDLPHSSDVNTLEKVYRKSAKLESEYLKRNS